MQIFQTIYKKIDQVLLKLYAKGWIHYINGPQTLPAPLGREEEQAIFEKLQTQPQYAKDMLIVHNLRLVVYIAKKFESTGINVEDLISIGTIGLIKAVNTFHRKKILSWPPMPPAVLKMRF